MAQTNPYFESLKSAYIFPVIEKKLLCLQEEHPNQKVLNLGIGDVCLPLAPKIAEAIKEAVDEMVIKPRGYGPCGGYPFLKEAICKNEYAEYGLTSDEVFISDGANSDAAMLQDLFAAETVVAITDPTYPVYRDATLLSGKTLVTLPLSEETGFIPQLPEGHVDLVYLCTPCNPTGVAMQRDDLQMWVDWAREHQAILLIDNVYNAFVSSEDVPASIYELDGAKEVAIEIRSFSKFGGFTGLRCGYSVVPKTLHLPQLNSLWQKYLDIKTNGISYPIQRGAEACFSDEGKAQIKDQLKIYQNSGRILRNTLKELDQTFFGGKDAPYLWWKTPPGTSSWDFFDRLLVHSNIISVPGCGFGTAGQGFVRLSCFLSNQLATEASDALHHYFAAV